MENKCSTDSASERQREQELGERARCGLKVWITCKVGARFQEISKGRIGFWREWEGTKSFYVGNTDQRRGRKNWKERWYWEKAVEEEVQRRVSEREGEVWKSWTMIRREESSSISWSLRFLWKGKFQFEDYERNKATIPCGNEELLKRWGERVERG